MHFRIQAELSHSRVTGHSTPSVSQEWGTKNCWKLNVVRFFDGLKEYMMEIISDFQPYLDSKGLYSCQPWNGVGGRAYCPMFCSVVAWIMFMNGRCSE